MFFIFSVVQAPAKDVVVVGLENGGIVLHNIRVDESCMKFQQDWGPVTTASFRTGEVYGNSAELLLFFFLSFFFYCIMLDLNGQQTRKGKHGKGAYETDRSCGQGICGRCKGEGGILEIK